MRNQQVWPEGFPFGFSWRCTDEKQPEFQQDYVIKFTSERGADKKKTVLWYAYFVSVFRVRALQIRSAICRRSKNNPMLRTLRSCGAAHPRKTR